MKIISFLLMFFVMLPVVAEPYNQNRQVKSKYEKRLEQQNNKNYITKTKRESYRKYYIHNPFFQPTEGKLGLVADINYNQISYTINPDTNIVALNEEAKWLTKTVNGKFDISYGVTDTFSVVGMVNYSDNKYTLDWIKSKDDTSSKSSLDIWGLGLRYRFLDNYDKIGTLSVSYLEYVDSLKGGVAELLIGHKINRTTLYLAGRGGYFDNKGVFFGDMIADTNLVFINYIGDKYSYIEGGLGLWTVLSEDITFGLEGVYGNYKWKDEAFVNAELGIQPGESFALSLYGKISVYDSSNNDQIEVWYGNPVTKIGTAKIKNFSNYIVGIKATLYF